MRREAYPDTQWLQNKRYVSDGKIVSSAGVSAAMPVSLALVEAIAGNDKANALAAELGVASWGPQHDSSVFAPSLGRNLGAHLSRYTNAWFHSTQAIDIPVQAGMDEITLAFAADAYSRTSRSHAYALAAGQQTVQTVLTRGGLALLPDRSASQPGDKVLPVLDGAAWQPGHALDSAIADIAAEYGSKTAYRVALDLEYPGFHP
jgi:hypothetical protein